MTAAHFVNQLREWQHPSELAKVQRFFSDAAGENQFIGVKMGAVFKLAKESSSMPLTEIAKLLDSVYYEARLGAVSVMDFMARSKKTSPEVKKQLYDLYLTKHDRINNWDLVDRAAPYVVGGYLADKPKKVLYSLARSKNVWERRTAIVATYYFIRQGLADETFKMAEILVNDPHDLINKAVGSWIREAGKKDKRQLLSFLDRHAGTMPRVTLRYAVEKLSTSEKQFYLKSK